MLWGQTTTIQSTKPIPNEFELISIEGSDSQRTRISRRMKVTVRRKKEHITKISHLGISNFFSIIDQLAKNSKHSSSFTYPEGSGEIDDCRLGGRVNWNTGVRVDADVASDINHYPALATPVRPHIPLSEQCSTDHAILRSFSTKGISRAVVKFPIASLKRLLNCQTLTTLMSTSSSQNRSFMIPALLTTMSMWPNVANVV